MNSDNLIKFEESNFDTLIDRFIEKYKELWDDFIFHEYENSMPGFIEKEQL